MRLDKEYWSSRYQSNTTGWDLGKVSPPLKAYIDQLENKNLKILIPGGGNSYEAEYLHLQGFKNVYVIDLALEPLHNLLQRNPTFPKSHLIQGDFFELQNNFDLILEQTFFCALPPKRRGDYAIKMAELLEPQGKLCGLLFDTEFEKEGPPFGGSKLEYLTYFSPFFKIKILASSYNSIAPRKGKELFFIFIKN